MCFFTRFGLAPPPNPGLALSEDAESWGPRGRGPVRRRLRHQAPRAPASPPRLAWGLALAPSLETGHVSAGGRQRRQEPGPGAGLGPGQAPRRLERSGGCGSMEDAGGGEGRGPPRRHARPGPVRRAAAGGDGAGGRRPGRRKPRRWGGAGLVRCAARASCAAPLQGRF